MYGSQCFYVFSCKLRHKHVRSLCNMQICPIHYERYRKSFAEYSARMSIKFSTRFGTICDDSYGLDGSLEIFS